MTAWEEQDLSGQRHVIIDQQGRVMRAEFGEGVKRAERAGGKWVPVEDPELIAFLDATQQKRPPED